MYTWANETNWLFYRYWREWLRCRSWLWTQSSIWHSIGARPVTRRVRTSRHKTLTTLASSSTATPCCCLPKWWVLAQKSIWVHFLVGMRSLAWCAIEAICATLGTTICSVSPDFVQVMVTRGNEIHTGSAPYPPQAPRGHPLKATTGTPYNLLSLLLP